MTVGGLLPEVLRAIRDRRADLEARFGVRLIGVVGSVARGEEHAESDVDITYEITGAPSLFDIIDAEIELADLFNRPVDLVDLNALRPVARNFVAKDLVCA